MIDQPDNVLVHFLVQLLGLECLVVAVARLTSWFWVNFDYCSDQGSARNMWRARSRALLFSAIWIWIDSSTHTRSSMSVPAFDYYRILGLTKDASSEDGTCIYVLFSLPMLNFWTVRRAYKQKVLETHPDKLPPDSTEEEKEAAREQFSKVRC